MRSILTIFLISQTAVFGDIAPSVFTGSGIVPVGDTVIQMKAAAVSIEWGAPCRLSADFKMWNDSPEARTLTIGFPVPSRDDRRSPDNRSIRFEIEGKTIEAFGPFIEEDKEPWQREWDWFRCVGGFDSGLTEISVISDLRPSRVYGREYAETLRYCVRTGGNWAGPIGSEKVEIIFPSDVDAGQIIDANPSDYEVTGSRVQWHFEDFEPTDESYDIRITYYRPDVMDFIATLRQAHEEDRENSAKAIKLAKHMLALGDSKSNSGFPPNEVDPDVFQEIIAATEDPKDQGVLRSHYALSDDGVYKASSSEWTPERIALIQILADAGYRDERSREDIIVRAESLLLDIIKRDQSNADAWNVYLANFWRFSFASTGHWFGRTVFGKRQIAEITRAAESCPSDECIQLWAKAIVDPPDGESKRKLYEELQNSEYLRLEFPPIDYDYY